MLNPNMGNRPDPRWPYWAADNGCFSDKWDEAKWWAWLTNLPVQGCLFAVCPDVVADAEATLARAAWLPKIRALGFSPAYVAQDGWDPTTVPWEDFDWLFIGGSDKFKLAAGPIIRDAKQRNKQVHVGRVNSYDRLRWARYFHADSADGTYIGFGPDINLPKVERWLRRVRPMTQRGIA
jgi:hypothetical protein